MIHASFSLLLLHAASSWYMTGLIWFVQVVHYPLMARAGRGMAEPDWIAYEKSHMSRTTWVVAPGMLVELAATVLVLAASPRRTAAWVGAAFLVIIWASTFGLQVPMHRRLSSRWDEPAHQRLVSTNWIRTLFWTGRSVLAGSMLLSP